MPGKCTSWLSVIEYLLNSKYVRLCFSVTCVLHCMWPPVKAENGIKAFRLKKSSRVKKIVLKCFFFKFLICKLHIHRYENSFMFYLLFLSLKVQKKLWSRIWIEIITEKEILWVNENNMKAISQNFVEKGNVSIENKNITWMIIIP